MWPSLCFSSSDMRFLCWLEVSSLEFLLRLLDVFPLRCEGLPDLSLASDLPPKATRPALWVPSPSLGPRNCVEEPRLHSRPSPWLYMLTSSCCVEYWVPCGDFSVCCPVFLSKRVCCWSFYSHVQIYACVIIVYWRVFCWSYLLLRLWVIVVFLGASYLWQNCPTVLFDRDQTLEVWSMNLS